MQAAWRGSAGLITEQFVIYIYTHCIHYLQPLLVSNVLLLNSSLDYLIAGQQFSLAGVSMSLLVSNELLLHSSLDTC